MIFFKRPDSDFGAALAYVEAQDYLYDENRNIAGRAFIAGVGHVRKQMNRENGMQYLMQLILGFFFGVGLILAAVFFRVALHVGVC